MGRRARRRLPEPRATARAARGGGDRRLREGPPVEARRRLTEALKVLWLAREAIGNRQQLLIRSATVKTVDELTGRFRAEGLRVTPQRQAIFRLLQDNVEHPTVESLYESARAAMPTISLKTVYQTVHDLEGLGEVALLDVGTGSVRVDPNVEDAHHHLICTRCGKVRDVLVDVASVRIPARERRGFTVDDVEVNFRGVCDECAATS
ncbi:MAG: transcriptional repressor [Actinobacteria bacterium]|nr:transcriptional repressor [Actinomycetota bacterium]